MRKSATRTGQSETTMQMSRDEGIWLSHPDHTPTTVTRERVIELADMLAKGKSRPTMIKYITENYGVTPRTAGDYYEAAVRYLVPEDWQSFRDEVIAKNIQSLQYIVEKTMEKENYKLATEAINTLNKIFNGGNQVTIAKDNNNNEVIQIKFE